MSKLHEILYSNVGKIVSACEKSALKYFEENCDIFILNESVIRLVLYDKYSTNQNPRIDVTVDFDMDEIFHELSEDIELASAMIPKLKSYISILEQSTKP